VRGARGAPARGAAGTARRDARRAREAPPRCDLVAARGRPLRVARAARLPRRPRGAEAGGGRDRGRREAVRRGLERAQVVLRLRGSGRDRSRGRKTCGGAVAWTSPRPMPRRSLIIGVLAALLWVASSQAAVSSTIYAYFDVDGGLQFRYADSS